MLSAITNTPTYKVACNNRSLSLAHVVVSGRWTCEQRRSPFCGCFGPRVDGGSAIIQGYRQIGTLSTQHTMSMAAVVISIPLSQKWGKSMKKFMRGFCGLFFFNSIGFIYLENRRRNTEQEIEPKLSDSWAHALKSSTLSFLILKLLVCLSPFRLW